MLRIIGKVFFLYSILLFTTNCFSVDDVKVDTIKEDLDYLTKNGYPDISVGYSSVIIDPAVIATLAQVVRWYNLSIKVIKSLLKSSSGKYKSLLSSSKNQTISTSSVLSTLFENKSKIKSDFHVKQLNHKGHTFIVGSIASTACLRESHEWVVNELIINKMPFVKNVLDDLFDSILIDEVEQDYENLNSGLKGNSSLLFLADSYTSESQERLEYSIKHFVNPDSFKNNPLNSGLVSNGEYYTIIERYRLMVTVVHNSLSNLYSRNLKLQSNVSVKEFDKRLEVSSFANNNNLSLQIKNKAGNYKQMAEMLSNLYMVNRDNNNNSITELMAVIATTSVDAAGDKL